MYKVNQLGLSLSNDFNLPLNSGHLYSNFDIQLPKDITSPRFLAFLSLASFNVIRSLWSERFEAHILYLHSYYSNLFPENPTTFPSPFNDIYDFSVKRLLPSWGASMINDLDTLGPLLVCLYLHPIKLLSVILLINYHLFSFQVLSLNWLLFND